MIGLRARLALAFGALAGAAAPLVAAEPPRQPEAYFSHPDLAQLALSPSGKRIAALAPVQGRVALVVMDVDARQPRVAVRADRADVNWFAWINDDRLVATAVDLQAGIDTLRGAGLHAVDHDGKDLVALGGAFFGTIDGGGDDVLVLATGRTHEHRDVYRVDSRTARRTLLTFDTPGNVTRWVADRDGAVRGAVNVEKGTIYRSWWRPDAASAWRQIGEYPMGRGAVYPVAFDGDGTLVVASAQGRDTLALYRFDERRNAPGELLAAHPHVDLDRGLVWDPVKRRIVGLYYDAMKPGHAWFDDDWAALAALVDRSLPGRHNAISRGHARKVLVTSISDRDPGSWHLLDLDARRLEFLGVHRKAIDPAAMPAREPLRYKARDGLEIPAYVTLPPGREAKSLPLVVVVHGGPFVRGASWLWRAEAAWLAAQGYAVLEPEFRGSTGWGGTLFAKGWKQWGRAMQDDLLDGVDVLAARGTIDPGRVCIMGASYGGYAALMGLARDPGRYRCGVNVAGVVDLHMLFDIAWSDLTYSDYLRYGARTLVGDPDTEADRLREVSPLEQAASIKAPVLMAYGSGDRRVPIVHGERMRDALRRNGTSVEWVVYTDEGHGLRREANRFDFYGRVQAFLAKHLQ